MWCPEPLNTHRNHTHTHTEVLWSRHESLDLRLKNTPPASCLQLSDAVNNQHQPSVWVCENRRIPPTHTHRHTHTHARTMLSQTSAGAGRPRLSVGMSRQSEHKWTGGRTESRFLKMCQKVIMWCDQAAVNGGSRLSWKKRSEKAVFTITQRLHELTEVTWGRRVMSQSKRSFKKVIEVGKNKTDTCLKLSRINGVFHSSDRMWAANRNKVNERSRSWGSWEIYK